MTNVILAIKTAIEKKKILVDCCFFFVLLFDIKKNLKRICRKMTSLNVGYYIVVGEFE